MKRNFSVIRKWGGGEIPNQVRDDIICTRGGTIGIHDETGLDRKYNSIGRGNNSFLWRDNSFFRDDRVSLLNTDCTVYNESFINNAGCSLARTVKGFVTGLIISLFILSATGALLSQEPLTIRKCIRLAHENSNILKSSEIALMQAEESIAESKSQQLPSVTVNSSYTRIGKITSFTMPMGDKTRTLMFGTPNRVNFDVRAQYALFTWGRIPNTIEMAEKGKGLSEAEKKLKTAQVTDQAIRAFYSVLLSEEIIRLNRSNLERANTLFKLTKERFESGGIPKLELLRAEVQKKTMESSLEEAKKNLIKSTIFLAKSTGLDYKTIAVQGVFSVDPVSADERELINRALSQRSELHVLQFQKEMGNHRVEIAQSGNKPNVFLSSSYNVMNGFNPMNPDEFVDNWNVGLQVSFPVFEGNATSHKVQNAELGIKSIEYQKKELEDVIRMQVRQSLVALQQAEDKIAAQAENIVLAREVLEVAEEQYRSGLVSSLDVLNAQQVLSQSEFMHTQAQFTYVMAKLDLCKALEDYSWFTK